MENTDPRALRCTPEFGVAVVQPHCPLRDLSGEKHCNFSNIYCRRIVECDVQAAPREARALVEAYRRVVERLSFNHHTPCADPACLLAGRIHQHAPDTPASRVARNIE